MVTAVELLFGRARAQLMQGSMMGGMTWLMTVFWLLIVASPVFAMAALVKYLFKK